MVKLDASIPWDDKQIEEWIIATLNYLMEMLNKKIPISEVHILL